MKYINKGVGVMTSHERLRQKLDHLNPYTHWGFVSMITDQVKVRRGSGRRLYKGVGVMKDEELKT
jgi:hypothetical protein